MVSVCLAGFFNLPPPFMANCTIPHVTNWRILTQNVLLKHKKKNKNEGMGKTS